MEIFDVMESCNRIEKRKFKQDAQLRFIQAESIAEHIGRYLNSDNKVRFPWDFFPTLFEEERKEYEAQQAQEQMEKAKENRKTYAAELKRRRESGIGQEVTE